jgi:hypothetical protein
MLDSLKPDHGVCHEGTTPTWTFYIRDHADDVLGSGDLTTVTLTSKHVVSGTVIRNAVNALNTNNCTVSAGGLFTWNLRTTDTVVTDTSLPVGQRDEYHAVVHWTWTDGNGVVMQGKRELSFFVKNL